MCLTTKARKSVLGERTFGKMRRQQEDKVLYAHCILFAILMLIHFEKGRHIVSMSAMARHVAVKMHILHSV